MDTDKRRTIKRFAALGALSPLAGFVEPTGDTTHTRSAIAGYVATTPGAHFSKIRDDLKLGTGETQHHLRQLLDAGAIETRRDGEYRRFFAADRFTSLEQVALGYLRRPTSRGLVLTLLRHPQATGSELAEILSVSQSTVSKYAAELERVGLLSRNDGYVLREPTTLLILVVRYADSFDEETRQFAAGAADLISFDRRDSG